MRKIHLIRELGFFDCVMLGIGFIIGSGVFIMPLVAAKLAGTYSLLAWLLAGVYSIFAGLSFAEAAAKIPKAGGLYTYAHQAFGDFVGFFAGWTFWIGYCVTIATEQWALGWYLRFFLPQYSDIIRVSVGALTGLVLTYFNYRGVKKGANIEDIFTVGKLLAIFIFIIGAALYFKVANLYPLAPSGTDLLPAVGSATVLLLWAYLGVEIITVPEEEIKNARKTVPRAIVLSVFSVIVIYLLLATFFLGAAPWEGFASSQSPLSDVFTSVTHSFIGGAIIAIGGLVSIVGSLNAVILGAARISFAMSRDGLFPRIFSKIHPKYETPYTAIALQTVLALLLTYSVTDFVALASLAVFFTIFPYALSSFATYKLIKQAKGKLHVLRHETIPIISGIASVALLFVYLNQPMILEIAGVMVFIGLLVFIERKKIRRL